MAIHDYKCNICGKITEINHKINENPEPICCGEIMEKQVSIPNFAFACGGFHQTDYGRIGQQAGYRKVRQKAEETIARKERRKKYGWQYK